MNSVVGISSIYLIQYNIVLPRLVYVVGISNVVCVWLIVMVHGRGIMNSWVIIADPCPCLLLICYLSGCRIGINGGIG